MITSETLTMHRHQTQGKSADTVDTAAVIGSSKEFVESACKLVKQILGSLSAIAVGVTKLRNQNGTGHGRALPVAARHCWPIPVTPPPAQCPTAR